MKTLSFIVVLTGIAGCAAAPVEMRYYPEGEPPPLVWPGPPETARLAYAGELVGEANFGPVAGEEDGAAKRNPAGHSPRRSGLLPTRQAAISSQTPTSAASFAWMPAAVPSASSATPFSNDRPAWLATRLAARSM